MLEDLDLLPAFCTQTSEMIHHHIQAHETFLQTPELDAEFSLPDPTFFQERSVRTW